jgi:hypothetical protein
LLESIEHRYWIFGSGSLPYARKDAIEAALKELVSFFLASVPNGIGDQFIRLRCHHCAEQLWIYSAQRTANPSIEKVGEVRVTNVVIIGWVGGVDRRLHCRQGCRIHLFYMTLHACRGQPIKDFGQSDYA